MQALKSSYHSPGMLAAAAALCFFTQASVADSADPSQPVAIEEVLVSAQKRVEKLQDVPVPLTVVNTDRLANSNEVRLRDYAGSVPGFTVTPSGQGYQYLTIRGISTGGTQNPTVGVVVDDVPYGSSTSNGGNGVPDFDPGDLERVEVLRGPQGTLYGANSMGGLVKFVTKDPSTDGFTGRVEAGNDYVHNGAEPGYDIRASANIPVSQSLAVRVSGFSRQDPGYIDNPILHIEGIDRAQAYGGRLSTLWRPFDELSVKISALYQHNSGTGVQQVSILPGLQGLQQSFPAGVGAFDRTVEAYNATVNYNIGTVTLTSVTGYNINRFSDSLDLTTTYASSAQKFFGVTGVGLFDDFPIRKVTQELRMTTPLGSRLDWLLGGFYTHESTPFHQTIEAQIPTSYQSSGQLGDLKFPYTFQEYAAFMDFTLHVMDRFDIQLGARDSEITTTAETSTNFGPIFTPSPAIGPPVTVKANAFTYLLTPRFQFSPDLMVYARLASGYRPGGTNSYASTLQGAPRGFGPDKTRNYEIGAKGDFFDRALTVDASVYYINWTDIQLKLVTPLSFGYSGNGGGAKSEGVELSAEAKPIRGLSISGWVSYDDAVITDVPGNAQLYLYSGEKLAYSSRFSGSLSFEEDFPLWNGMTGFVGGMASYVGERTGIFTGTAGHPAPRQIYPGYTKTDLNAGIEYNSWRTNFYVDNVADVRGLMGGGIGFTPPTAFTYIRPRTIGASVTKSF